MPPKFRRIGLALRIGSNPHISAATLLERNFDLFRDVLTPEFARPVLAWHADDETEQSLDEMGEMCNKGTISAAEREEYEAYVRSIDFIGILQAKSPRRVAAKWKQRLRTTARLSLIDWIISLLDKLAAKLNTTCVIHVQ